MSCNWMLDLQGFNQLINWFSGAEYNNKTQVKVHTSSGKKITSSITGSGAWIIFCRVGKQKFGFFFSATSVC